MGVVRQQTTEATARELFLSLEFLLSPPDVAEQTKSQRAR